MRPKKGHQDRQTRALKALNPEKNKLVSSQLKAKAFTAKYCF